MNVLIKILLVISSVLGALLVSCSLENGWIPVYDIFSTGKNGDFEFADSYARINESSPSHTLSDSVIVVSTTGCNRQDVAELIIALDSLNVRSIGLDLLFLDERPEEDSVLINAIQQSKNIVLPYGLNSRVESEQYCISDSSYFYGKLKGDNIHYGSINLNAEAMADKIRRFSTSFQLEGGDEFQSFAAVLAEVSSPESFVKLNDADRQRNERIRFAGVEIETMDWYDILPQDAVQPIDSISLAKLSGKVVLVGDTQAADDIHNTPFGEKAGVIIHAYALNTILSSKYITDAPRWVNYLLAICISFVFIARVVYLRSSDKYRYSGRLRVRVLQALLIILFFIAGSTLYLKFGYYINFSTTIVMIGLSVIVLDFMTGILGKALQFWNKFHPSNAAICAILAIVGSIGVASAQKSIYVSKQPYPKGVQIKTSKGYADVTPYRTLNPSDVLFLKKGAVVKIIDRRWSGRAYLWNESGSKSVAGIIDACNGWNGWFVKMQNTMSGRKCIRKGVHTMSSNALEDEMASFIKDCLDNQWTKGRKISSKDQLKLSRQYIGDDEFTMTITNNDTVRYYVNVVCVDKNEHSANICYNIDGRVEDVDYDASICVEPGMELSLAEYTFVGDKNWDYYLIASKEEFSWGLLQKILDDKDARRVPYDATQFRMCRMRGK